MRKSTRALVGMVGLNVLVLIGSGYMVLQTRSGAWQTSNKAEAIALITNTAGAMIGVITALLLVAFFGHRRRGN